MKEGTSLKIRGYKCFGERPEGFETLAALNLIIGRNDSGKSALLDLVEHAVDSANLLVHSHKGIQPQIQITLPLTEDVIRRIFPENTSQGGIPGNNHFEYGRQFIGEYVTLEKLPTENRRQRYAFVSTSAEYIQAATRQFTQELPGSIEDPFAAVKFKRLNAERDIQPELQGGELKLERNGEGATSIIRDFINNEARDASLVEVDLLQDLNAIMQPDSIFSRVAVQHDANRKWEVFLDQSGKGRIRLSASGSGLKTVMLVLIHFLLLPQLEGASLDQYLFAFEELENNLHPSLQRRLLAYIAAKTRQSGLTCFIATHSPAIIDMFCRDDDAQILHVMHDGSQARVVEIRSTEQELSALDDLGVKASDILQANGVIWVEGISDRVYISRWLELYCEGNSFPMPQEGVHFLFLEYGGRCLSHYQFSELDPESCEEELQLLIPAMRISRNRYVVMDSDRCKEDDNLSATKQRVCSEAGSSWVTAGRQIENYLPAEVQQNLFGRGLAPFEPLPANPSGAKTKRQIADAAIVQLTAENWGQLDLKDQIRKLFEAIRQWNQPV